MMNRFIQIHKIISLAWLSLIVGCTLYCAHALINQERIKFDILDMLPASQSESISQTRRMISDANITQRVVFLVGHHDSKVANASLDKLKVMLDQSNLPMQEQSVQEISNGYTELFSKLFAARANFVTDEDRDQIEQSSEDELVSRAIAEIMSPFSPINLQQDPFNLFTHYVKSNTPLSSFQIDSNDNLYTQGHGKTWFVYLGTVTEPAFSMETQRKFNKIITPILAELSQHSDIEVLRTGAIFYATAGAEQAQNEISLIGTLSLLGIVILMILVFRNLTSLFFTMTVIGVSLILGLALCLMVFGTIHIIALVIGSSLVGITVDYALHYICASYQRFLTPYDIFNKLVPALPLSTLTSASGFILLLFVPFPGIQQMAVLSSVGLLGALITVFLWGPYLVPHKAKEVSAFGQNCQRVLTVFAGYGTKTKVRMLIFIISTVILFGGGSQLTFDDNLKSFQNLNSILKQQEDKINSMLNFDGSTKFLAIKGTSVQDILKQEEALFPELRIRGVSYKALATLFPSIERQENNKQLLKDKLYTPVIFDKLAQSLGQPISCDFDKLGLFASVIDLEKENLITGLKELIYTSDVDSITGRIMIANEPDTADLKSLTDANPNVLYIDPALEYSKLFHLYRQLVMGLMVIILIGLFAILSYYINWQGSLSILTPITLSLLVSIGTLGLIMPLNLFHAMGLLLSLCIGVDYALFLYWHKPSVSDQKKDILLMCNGLSALTTILSFGLLAFSQTKAVYSFGLSVFIGITGSFVFTTLFLGTGRTSND